MLKIVFAGTPEFACPCLQALQESEHKVLAVYTQPDRPAGRGRQLTASPVKQLADLHNIPVFQPETLRDEAEHGILRALGADVMVVVAYGLLLPQAVLDIPRYGCVNVHASLLPRWRGAAPIQQAILAGDEQSGVTIMQMEAGLDTGPMLNKIQCSISNTDTSADLHDRLAKIAPEALLMTLEALETGRAKPVKQDNSLATHATKIQKNDAQINWHQRALTIQRMIRAYNPWPVAFALLNDKRIRLFSAEVLNETSDAIPGTIIRAENHGIDVATAQGVLRILTLQLPGGKTLPVADVLNSKRDWFAVGQSFLTLEDSDDDS